MRAINQQLSAEDCTVFQLFSVRQRQRMCFLLTTQAGLKGHHAPFIV